MKMDLKVLQYKPIYECWNKPKTQLFIKYFILNWINGQDILAIL